MDSHRFFNRELSWLDFNRRVLAIAEDPGTPLLERAKFVAISATNLDEFFEVRVAGLKEQVAAGVRKTPPDGLTASEQLTAIRAEVSDHYKRQSRAFVDEIAPGLAKEGVKFSDWATLDDEDRDWLSGEFRRRVFPVLTPLSVDPAHPFPYISNLSLNLAVGVRDPDSEATRFARVKIPQTLARFVLLPDGERYVPLEDVIAAHLDELFPGMEIVAHYPFRVTRNADLAIEEEEADDLLEAIETELTRRRFKRVVRLEVDTTISDEALHILMRELGVADEDVYIVDCPLDLGGLWGLFELDRDDLKWEQWTPVTPNRLAPEAGEPPDIFEVIKRGELLVHHPYDSFSATVEEFLRQAALDPDVLAIKQTLYRTSTHSPIVKLLIEAAERGKQVVVLVELRARFDEQRNIEWARVLEEAGVHVVWGVVGLKTHTKTALVVRKEGGHLRRYCHIGTGNFNPATARIYEDLGLATADEDLGADLSDLFNFLTGYSKQRRYRKLLVAPTRLRKELRTRIRNEAEHDDGHIIMKMNALVDARMIEALYEASAAGTKIELIVRGICCLRPGVPGLSDNITVRSIVGRYLEHSRIYRFGSEARKYDFLIGSADIMPRNLNRRVEAITPVEDPDLQQRLHEVLDVLLADDELAWELEDDGTWRRVPHNQGLETHLELQQRALERAHPGR